MWCAVNVPESGLFCPGTFDVGRAGREELPWLGVSIWDCQIGVLSCVLLDRDGSRCWRVKISGLFIFAGKKVAIVWIGRIGVLEKITQLCVCYVPN